MQSSPPYPRKPLPLLRSTSSPWWRVVLCTLTALAVAVTILFGPAGSAFAGPDGSNDLATLHAQLDAAAKAYNDAKGRLDVARAKQAEISRQAHASAEALTALRGQVQSLAATMYTDTRISNLAVLLDAGSAEDFLDRATSLRAQAEIESEQLRALSAEQKRYDQLRADLATQVAVEQNQLALMEKKKKDAEKALAAASGGAPTTGPTTTSRPSATPAPRNADGSWPAESCSQDDPTTSGCLTPRTLHAYQEVKKAGFTHYVSCYRPGTSGEHPKGRACDWSANANGFVNAVATGSDKAYGDQLASWLIANADRLAILYVIWYKRIWLPGSGWRSYGGDGTPAGDHYNHVHMSIQ